MSDYIKRVDAINAAKKMDVFAFTCLVETVHRIQELPAADVVEVVRCKDCKHAKRNDKHPDKPLICYLTRRVGEVKDEWYCADGERR